MQAEMIDPIQNLHNVDSELVVGLVGAIGTDLSRVSEILDAQLRRMGYDVVHVKISGQVIPLFGTVVFNENDECDRVRNLMHAGNEARRKSKDNSILALGAATLIASSRSLPQTPQYQKAFIVNSLKRPEEVERLRQIYSSGFVLLGVHAEEARRIEELCSKDIQTVDAKLLIERDSKENIVPHGQRLEDTFYLSDFFVKLDGNDDLLKSEIRRITELLFGHPFHTPSFDEYAMFFAFAAALRSADLSRQVGAVIARDSQILATGANDCPKAGGGLYWPERDELGRLTDFPNGRDFTRGIDSNKKEQKAIIDKIVELGERRGIPPNELRDVLSSKESPIGDLTEYGRVVHAEMDALTSCARNHLSPKEATLYCTTFPCHNCAKHILAAGIKRVVFIEPYEKSKAFDFHQDSVLFDAQSSNADKAQFEPFFGIGPRKFFDLFSMKLSSGYDVVRSDKKTGVKFDWKHDEARLRLQMLPLTYLDLELQAAELFQKLRGDHADE
ncbi:anti-phage dCTP deaminase [Blastopirellula marina]|uniref:Probable Cytidine deaminase n=1 Tax=Blastopirellula marina DSM 3645 TaxID=314230 RepID=A3ZZL0_9BACT|nr:anti-phage dCTP deaminase [Blastopirellula marina]EAQ77989.1 probable Cytidine deaminase [Blastopirellula marina DSM 3645]